VAKIAKNILASSLKNKVTSMLFKISSYEYFVVFIIIQII
jgi:hypothetical protein